MKRQLDLAKAQSIKYSVKDEATGAETMITAEKVASFRDRIQKAMAEKQESSKWLAQNSGADPSQICRYLSGKAKPRQKMMENLAGALDVSVLWLYGFDVPKKLTSAVVVEKMPKSFLIESRVKHALAYNEKTLSDLCHEVGVCREKMIMCMEKKCEVTDEILQKTATALNVPAAWLSGQDDSFYLPNKTGSFSQRIVPILCYRGMTTVDLAGKIGMDRERLSIYKVGRYVPEIETLKKIAEALDVSDRWLRGYDVQIMKDDPDFVFPEKVSSFRVRLREALKLRNKTIAALVRESGVARSSIDNYLAGRGEPFVAKAKKIAHTLCVSDLWLRGFDVPVERADGIKHSLEITATTQGERLKRIMQFQGRTIASLARESGVSRSTISNCLMGATALRSQSLEKIASVLEVSVGMILDTKPIVLS